MKIKIILFITIIIGVTISVVYQKVEQKVVNQVSAQIGGGCSSYLPATDSCGDNESCGLGIYTSSAAFYNGAGMDGVEPRSVPCQGTTCGTIPNVPTAYFNGDCCDQDHDGYDSTASGCGGTDCNDDPNNNGYYIHPGAAETCGDGIDNNCNGQIDEDCPTPTLILTNDKGEIINSWIGKLPPDKEEEVINRLNS